jgi:hypothetical protein
VPADGVTGAAARRCSALRGDGQPCRATPGRDATFCFVHNPDLAREAAEARRLGGLRRRREKTLAGVYDLSGLATVAAIRRILEIGLLDALSLENSVARARALISGAQAAAKLLETGELEARLAAVEAQLAQKGSSDRVPGGGKS